jgi:hypothetical protein
MVCDISFHASQVRGAIHRRKGLLPGWRDSIWVDVKVNDIDVGASLGKTGVQILLCR